MKSSAFRRTRRVFRWMWGWWNWCLLGIRRPFAYVLGGTWAFIVRWWTTRQAARLLGGLPALIVGVAVIGILFAAQLAAVNQRKLHDAYLNAATAAQSRGNYAQAKLYLERLVQSPSVDTSILFDYAKAAQQAEDYPRMAATLRTLAPADRAVFGPAHLWQAVQYLSSASPSKDDLKAAQIHLQHTLRLNSSDVNAHRLLGEIYFWQGQWNDALPHLLEAVHHSPRHKLMLAKACGMLNDEKRMVRYADEARQYFAEQSILAPEEVKTRVDWAEAAMLLDRFDLSASVLKDALKLKDDPAIRRALARVFTAWFDSLEQTKSPDREFQFDLLATGIATYPDEPMLFDRLLRLLVQAETVADGVRSFLNKNIVEGRAIGLSHLLLGAEAFQTGQTEQAKTHLERAFEMLPQADVAANNLAWILGHAEPPQTDRALSMIEPVIQRHPNEVRYIDTRGHILLKAGKYREAITDLERFLGQNPNNPVTHASLAECYGQIGLAELAEGHRTAYKRLTEATLRN